MWGDLERVLYERIKDQVEVRFGCSIEAFEQGLKDLGWEDGRNITLEWRWAQGDVARYPTLAAELARLNLDVIVAPDEARVNAVRQATHTTPIVFGVVGDPVAVGYAASLRRPGGMLTGLSSQWYELTGKRLEILKDAAPKAEPVAVLRIADPDEHLDSPIEIAVHHVGAPDPDLLGIRLAESVDA